MNKPYKIYIDNMLMPLAPSKIDCNIKSKNEIVTLLNGEELNLIRDPGLIEYEFELYLPSEKIPSISEFVPPFEIVSHLQKLKDDKKIFQFMIIRSPSGLDLEDSINKTVTLEDMSVKEDSESLGRDVLVSLSIKTYKKVKTETLELTDTDKIIKKSTPITGSAKVNGIYAGINLIGEVIDRLLLSGRKNEKK